MREACTPVGRLCLPVLASIGAMLCCIDTARAAQESKRIVLIGGVKSHGPAEHDFPNGIRLLEGFLKSSPDVQSLGKVAIDAYPDGWPKDPAVLDDASTIVWYFDGLESHPLLDANRRAQFEQLMNRGIGLVTLHQASTLLPGDTLIHLPDWLGGARYGMVDRTHEMVEFKPAVHPVSRGVGPFTYRDEFYPTIRFLPRPATITPILTGKLHVQVHNDKPIVTETVLRPVAWAFERPGGGRAFGFTGLHYLVGLDQPELRKLLLNAIVWTAGSDVPDTGVRSGMPDAATSIRTEAVVIRPADNKVIEQPWGVLTWYVSGELKNSDTMTVGQAVIRPGQQNPRHFHPNCDEVLHVIQGHILHTLNERTVEMRTGDTLSIPKGVMHNAKNIGTEEAVLAISFSSADRKVVGE